MDPSILARRARRRKRTAL